MKALRLPVSALALLAHILQGIFLLVLLYWWLPQPQQKSLTRWWSRLALKCCHTRVVLRGTVPAAGQGLMVVSNHISWLDIPIINSVAPLRFVAKAEIRDWLLVGFLCARSGTIFIRRSQRHAVHQVMQYLKEVMRRGGHVGVFPEGTTSAGEALLPFHANLMQAAINAGVPIVPASLRYRDASGQPTREAAYIDQMTIVDSLRNVLGSGGLVAELTFLELIAVTPDASRHDLARQAHAAIAQNLGFAQPDS